MYKRVKAIENEEDYSELVDEMTDRFGDLPLEADLLLRVGRIKAWGRLAGVESIKKPRRLSRFVYRRKGLADGWWQKLYPNRWTSVEQSALRWKREN